MLDKRRLTMTNGILYILTIPCDQHIYWKNDEYTWMIKIKHPKMFIKPEEKKSPNKTISTECGAKSR